MPGLSDARWVTYDPFGTKYDVEQWQPPTVFGVDPIPLMLGLARAPAGVGRTSLSLGNPREWGRQAIQTFDDFVYGPQLRRPPATWKEYGQWFDSGRPRNMLAGAVLGGAGYEFASELADAWRGYKRGRAPIESEEMRRARQHGSSTAGGVPARNSTWGW